MEKKPKLVTITRSNSLKVPQVKMTKTARMRLLKANPLLKYEAEKTNSELVKNFDLDDVSRIRKIIADKNESLILNKNHVVNQEPKKSELCAVSTKMNKPQEKSKKVPVSNGIKESRTLRRSFSVPRIGTKICTIIESEQTLENSISDENIPYLTNGFSNKQADSAHNFKTTSNKRHSIFNHSSSHRTSQFCPTPSAPVDLRRRLSDWLVKQKKQPSSFKHLKCFGVHKINVIREGNKENVNTSVLKDQGSYENLKINEPSCSIKHQEETLLTFAPSDFIRIAKHALGDLLSLISEGYMKEQCEAWLRLIQQRCPQVMEEPQYWECRAAIEQLRGELGSAVECYKTAVVQGAEVSSVEKSLDELLNKFKLLDIDSAATQEESGNVKAKMINDFKNVFTSMIIKFAIQEKSLKKKSEIPRELTSSSNLSKVLVTPVRRSTRLNRSMYTSTPGVKICSFNEIDSDVKERMSFQPNLALNI